MEMGPTILPKPGSDPGFRTISKPGLTRVLEQFHEIAGDLVFLQKPGLTPVLERCRN
jgi:hypothetical protein